MEPPYPPPPSAIVMSRKRWARSIHQTLTTIFGHLEPNSTQSVALPREINQPHRSFIILTSGFRGGPQAPPPPFEIPKRVFKRDPPKTFAPAALAVAAAPPPPLPQILDPPLILGRHCLVQSGGGGGGQPMGVCPFSPRPTSRNLLGAPASPLDPHWTGQQNANASSDHRLLRSLGRTRVRGGGDII